MAKSIEDDVIDLSDFFIDEDDDDDLNKDFRYDDDNDNYED